MARGCTRYMGNVILGLLLIGPSTLYAINKQFEQGISLFYSASLGSLRTALLSLEKRGFIAGVDSVENGRNKRNFSITDDGRDAFFEWMYSPIVKGDIETIALSKLYFVGWLPDAPARHIVLNDIEQLVAADEAQLIQLGEQLDAKAESVPESYREVFKYQRLTLEYGIGAHRFGREFFARVAASDSP